MDKRIVIKEVDKFKSALHKDRIVSEYLIFVNLDLQPLEAYTEIGENAKNARVNELILLNFVSEDMGQDQINKEDIIEEISFEEYAKELKKIWKK